MARREFLQVDENSFDMLVEVEFDKQLDDTDIVRVLGIIEPILNRGQAANRFEGVSELQITQTSFVFRLRYYTRKENEPKKGYDDVVMHWFIYYLLAKVDSKYKIGKHPFHVELPFV